MGVILGGNLDAQRSQPVRELLLKADLAYTVHAPLEVNLMDLTAPDVQRDVLKASLWFANSIGADVMVCNTGQRIGSRNARYSLREQLTSEHPTPPRRAAGVATLGFPLKITHLGDAPPPCAP